MADQSGASIEVIRQRSYFLIRRLHSLLGIVPVGAFLCVHLTINATILLGGDKFGLAVDLIHMLERFHLLIPVEIAFIFLPILFHAVLGVVIALSGTVNVDRYKYCGNIRYVIQRGTGLFAFAFILAHLWQMHWIGSPLGGGEFVAHDASNAFAAASSAAAAIQSSVLWIVFYALGVIACVFHLANGVWTTLITWGVTVGPRSQKGAAVVCGAFCLGLIGIGLGALLGFCLVDPQADETPAVGHEVVAQVAQMESGSGASKTN